MTFIEWSDGYSVKNAKMDEQHQMLFQYVNEFYEASENGKPHGELIIIFDKIIEYTHYHFQDEETIMAEANFPNLETHKAVHAQLVERVMDYKNRLQTENGVATEIKFFLKNWLTMHIAINDKEYSACLETLD